MDLGLDLSPVLGRPKRPVEAEIVRALNAEDLALLTLEKGIKPQTVKKLRDSHHALARTLAMGATGQEASLVTGYTASRISILRGDPAFEELVEFYRTHQGAPVAEYIERLTAIKFAAAERMLDILEDDAVAPSPDFILDAAKFAADRSGHGPQSKSTNVNVNVNLADRLAAGRQRAAQVLDMTPTVIDVPAEESGRIGTPVSTPPALSSVTVDPTREVGE